MKASTLTLSAVLATAVLLPATTASAHAPAAKAKSTVTIKAEGTDLSGTLKSPKQSCVTERKVLVIKQVGARGGGDDQKFASDVASADGSWSTGQTGTEGRFYAKVRATATCAGDTSPTIRATR